ncbi:PREDICTED: guanine nucleotide exchange factor DBS-like [Branchiostoma belcheri]|uniref:Guanine nucleotide exchange factor DBS-like n=1 Tax=Branchiostoma belcheri TaxID=7741 RepID=A0A6P4YE37_BRABE|nr:PREDICTED: guanine nucleotide exchange factor DBS-like [Branchiostoma belcheri]
MAEVTAISEGGSDVPPSQHPEVPPSFPDSDTPPPAQSTVQSDSQAGNTCANVSPANQNLSCTDVNSITSISLEEQTGNKHGGSSDECVEEKLEKDEGSTNTGKCTANPHSHSCTDGNSISLEKPANKHGGSSGNCKEELRKDGGRSNECVGEELGTDGGSANTGKCTNGEPPHTCAAPGEELPHTCADEHLQEAGETSPGRTPEEQYENLYTCLQVARMPDEVMDQHGQALRVVDIAEQLQARFAYLTGGKGRNGAPIITLPEYPRFQEIQDQDFLSVMTYLTSIPSAEEAELGYVIVVDRRQDRWAAVKATLIRIAGFFPKHIQVVLVLRPTGFFQRTFSDIGFKFVREDFRLKVPMVMLNSVSELHEHLDRSQLTEELGGFIRYEHHDWIEQRSAIEKFASNTHDIAKTLQQLGTELAETELPNDIVTTESLLEQQRKQKEEIKETDKAFDEF